MKTFYNYNFNGKNISFHEDSIIKVQIGKGSSAYKESYSFSAADFSKAVMHYNCINIGNGYKKRLYCDSLNKKTLHKVLT